MNKSAREKEAVLNVFASLVRPLTRVAFEYGISASEISGVVRRTYIQALEARLHDQKRATTDARLAVVAGLTKSDVTALREATRSGAPHSLRATVSLDQVTNLLTVWHTHSGFSGAYGLALELDLARFPVLRAGVSRDLVLPPVPGADEEALLDELVAAGSVEVIRLDAPCAVCRERTFRRAPMLNESNGWGEFLAVDSRAISFITCCELASEPIYFERTVLSDEPFRNWDATSFLSWPRRAGQELLTELDTFLTRLASTGGNESGKKYGVGIYFFEDQPTDTTGRTAIERRI